jgi:hypothetical protein
LFLGLGQKELGKICGCSVHTIQSVELARGRLALSEELATKLLIETHISPEWLLSNDLKAPLVSANGEPYTVEMFHRAQAEKETDKGKGLFYRGHWYFRLTNAIGFCTQLFAILESASAQKKYYMGAYKVGKALNSLRNEFGQNLQIYPMTHSPHLVIDAGALQVLGQLLDRGQKEVDKSNQRYAALMARTKRSSSQQRKMKRA